MTGGRGRLGQAIVRRGGEHDIVALGRAELDVCDPVMVARRLDELAPALVIDAAGFTAVDRAERERAAAFAVNADGAGVVARACAARGVPVLHVSTECVFDGALGRPYREDDAVAPLGVYGASKAAGERAVREAGGTVVRTSWLFATGGAGFVQAILARATHDEVVQVVDDRRGCPTWVDDLADGLLALAGAPPAIYHLAGAGPITRYGFALAIVEAARRHRALRGARIEPVASAAWPLAAARPANAVLDTGRARALGVALPAWHAGLAAVVAEELA